MPGARILVVEDDSVLLELIGRNLQKRGYDVHVARNAQTALESLRSLPFDLMFLDINLPDETGWEVLRRAQKEGLPSLARKEPDGYLPVVILSAVQVGARRLAQFHPIAYLPKPFPLDSLLRLAAEAARRKAGSPGADKQGSAFVERGSEEALHA